MNPQPRICVADVETSSRWHRQLFGCRSSHGGKKCERLTVGGRLVLQLHKWEVDHHHGPIGDKHREYWIRDPDGYAIVRASPDGSATGNWKPGDEGERPRPAGGNCGRLACVRFWSA